MSDIGGYDDEELPLPAMRGRVNRDFIPTVRLPASSTPAPQRFAEPVPVELPKPQPAPPNEWLTLADQVKKQWGVKDDDGKVDELREILRGLYSTEAYKPPAADTTAAPPTAQARVLDPTQAPEGSAEVDPTGVPANYFAKNRAGESGGNDAAVNKITGAAGRYQFMPSTAEGIIKANPHLGITANWRTNPEDQEKLMRAYTQQSVGILKPMLKRDPTGGELYALHLFGHGGGQRVLGQLDKPIVEITTAAERASNPFLNRFKTGRDMLAYFNKNF